VTATATVGVARYAYDERPITVYHVVRTEKVRCDLGELHERDLVVRKFLGPVVDTVPFDNGYAVVSERVRLDAQGRRWESRSPIDAWGGTTWIPPVAYGHWSARPPARMHRLLEPSDVTFKARVVWS
jgi:hypothetical protein